MSAVVYRSTKELPIADVVHLYSLNRWSSASKPELLLKALFSSDTLVSAWDGCKLVGLGNAISDGYLVVYYPHLVILPEYQGQGIGTEVMARLKGKYKDFHQHMIVAGADAVAFYESVGFSRAGETVPMWIFDGNEH